VGFPRRDPDRLKVALANTHRLIWIRSTKQSRVARLGQLVGFARATSDGVFSATIWDVAVSPAWQRSGLGRAMMERLTKELVEDGIATITLYAEPQVVGLYKKLGFVDDPEGIKAMAFQKQSQKAKAKAWF
jgi:ribosomal protein S18 acetylase RimI-like enzyme